VGGPVVTAHACRPCPLTCWHSPHHPHGCLPHHPYAWSSTRSSPAGGLAAENLFAALVSGEHYSLEIWSEHRGHHLLVRAPSTVMPLVLEPIRGVYPQAATHPLPCAGSGDPAFLARGETLLAVELRLEAPAYLPLRTFCDEDFAIADPLAGTRSVGSQVVLHPDERLLSQIILWPAPASWGRPWARLARDATPFDTLPAMRTLPGNARAGLTLLLVACGGAALLLGGLQFLAGHLLESVLTLGVGAALSIPLGWGVHRLGQVPIPDPPLVREKLSSGPGFHAWIRLPAIGRDRRRLEQKLHQLVAAYRQVQHGLGNNLQPHPLPDDLAPYDLYTDPLAWSIPGFQRRPPWCTLPLLTARELATLWHLPHRDVELQLLSRPRYRRTRSVPPLQQVQAGDLIGREEHLGRQVTVRLPRADLQKHTLLVGTRSARSVWKTQRGKLALSGAEGSTLMGHLVDAAIRAGESPPAQAGLGAWAGQRRPGHRSPRRSGPTGRHAMRAARLAGAAGPRRLRGPGRPGPARQAQA